MTYISVEINKYTISCSFYKKEHILVFYYFIYQYNEYNNTQ